MFTKKMCREKHFKYTNVNVSSYMVFAIERHIYTKIAQNKYNLKQRTFIFESHKTESWGEVRTHFKMMSEMHCYTFSFMFS